MARYFTLPSATGTSKSSYFWKNGCGLMFDGMNGTEVGLSSLGYNWLVTGIFVIAFLVKVVKVLF